MISKRCFAFAPALAVVAILALSTRESSAQSIVLDPLSASLPGIPATSSAILKPSSAPPAAPSPSVAMSSAKLGLLAGDVIDAIYFSDDAAPGAPNTIYFSVSRGPMGPGPVAPPDVKGESVTFLPPATQDEAAGDIFESNDSVCLGLGVHTQVLDGNGALLGPPSLCGFGGGAPYGLGLTELLPTPPVTFNDNVSAFDWSVTGRGRIYGIFLSLAPGSPSLTPATNPLLPAGGSPGDILISIPGTAPASSPSLFTGITAAALGLLPGDDIDALTGGFEFSLTPASTSVVGPPFFSAADILSFGPAVVLPAAALGLMPTDDVDALESTGHLCPVMPSADAPDFDGVAAGPGCDNCPAVMNPGQEDSDFDGIGDVCDLCTDTDSDGFGNMDFPANTCPTDLCPYTPGPNIDTDSDGWADECDNCPFFANTAQTDTDFDGVGDPCDPCPHIFAAGPSAFTTLKGAGLGYKNNGPGTGDDSVKTSGSFTTGTAFDPDSTDNVRVTLTNTATSTTLSTTLMTAASTFWTQPNPAKLAWKFADAGPPAIKAGIKESPAASTIYKFKLGVKTISLAGPQITPATDDIRVTVEITPANLCFDGTLSTCTSSPLKKDGCKP